MNSKPGNIKKNGTSTPDPENPAFYFNRELSWIEFNRRVLDEATDPSNPPLERLKFLSVFHNNLDEFFMVRVASLYKQYLSGSGRSAPDGMTPLKTLTAVRRQIIPMLSAAQSFWTRTLHPLLFEKGVHIVSYDDLQEKNKKFLQDYYQTEIYPILTPQAVDPGRPFPVISNESLNILVELSPSIGDSSFARLKIPGNISRFLFVPRNKEARTYASLGFSSNVHNNDIVFLEDIIYRNLGSLFPGWHVAGAALFRVTRNTDFDIEADEEGDLLELVRDMVDQRRFGEAVRLEISRGAPRSILNFLTDRLSLLPFQIYRLRGPLGLADLMTLYRVDRPDLKFRSYTPRIPPPFSEDRLQAGGCDIYPILRNNDLMLYHPYDSFAPVMDFLRRAAEDPRVMAIKQTLYRVDNESPVVEALIQAKRNGKQVTAVVELKARFDEERNIRWVDAFWDEGLHVVYGLPGMKIHAKLCLVLRREDDGIHRYVHIGTGNYNSVTAKAYSDLGFFTANPEICSDVTDLFNVMTGFARKSEYRRLLVSPVSTRAGITGRIEREIQIHKKQGGGKIYFKCNHLVDPLCIQALYRAGQAGVDIRLQVRGICCLRPGIRGLSEGITVTSLVGRFLEHTRIYYFGNGGDGEMYTGSADLMPRNLDRRIEVLMPVLDPVLRQNILNDILLVHLNDNVGTGILRQDGVYVRRTPGDGEKPATPIDSQKIMMERENGWNAPISANSPAETDNARPGKKKAARRRKKAAP